MRGQGSEFGVRSSESEEHKEFSIFAPRSPTPNPQPPTPVFQSAIRNPQSAILQGPLYAIADTLGRAELSYPDLAEKICAGGAKLLQLRVKDASTREFLTIAQEVRVICRHYGCWLIINDRADIALAVDADGVHVGQEDLPLRATRKVVGPHKIIGVSTHDSQQAITAARDGADYIGFGPLFVTTTKATGYSARGLDQLREIRALVSIPIVAIGGITTERAPAVLTAGADAVAMISEIVLAQDVSAKVGEVLQGLTGR